MFLKTFFVVRERWDVKGERFGGEALAFLRFTFYLSPFTVPEDDGFSNLLLTVGWTEEQDIESDGEPKQYRPDE
jgi:hypothetical protein